jgi:hypothetical protein
MAEPFGTVAGAIGIASSFTACVDCFEYVQFGRYFGRDFQTGKLVSAVRDSGVFLKSNTILN